MNKKRKQCYRRLIQEITVFAQKHGFTKYKKERGKKSEKWFRWYNEKDWKIDSIYLILPLTYNITIGFSIAFKYKPKNGEKVSILQSTMYQIEIIRLLPLPGRFWPRNFWCKRGIKKILTALEENIAWFEQFRTAEQCLNILMKAERNPDDYWFYCGVSSGSPLFNDSVKLLKDAMEKSEDERGLTIPPDYSMTDLNKKRKQCYQKMIHEITAFAHKHGFTKYEKETTSHHYKWVHKWYKETEWRRDSIECSLLAWHYVDINFRVRCIFERDGERRTRVIQTKEIASGLIPGRIWPQGYWCKRGIQLILMGLEKNIAWFEQYRTPEQCLNMLKEAEKHSDRWYKYCQPRPGTPAFNDVKEILMDIREKIKIEE